MPESTRRYERIDIHLPVRLYVPGEGGLKFEAFCVSNNLGLGGLFMSSSFLLREGVELVAELGLPSGPPRAAGEGCATRARARARARARFRPRRGLSLR